MTDDRSFEQRREAIEAWLRNDPLRQHSGLDEDQLALDAQVSAAQILAAAGVPELLERVGDLDAVEADWFERVNSMELELVAFQERAEKAEAEAKRAARGLMAIKLQRTERELAEAQAAAREATEALRRDLAVAIIARELDRPSLYMGGPSQRSLRRAEQIVMALEAHDLLSVALRTPERSQGDENVQ